jgi:hypothetical protein
MPCTDIVSGFQSGVVFELVPQGRSFPFHRLPFDLSITIFKEVERSSRTYDRHSIPSPVILSHVCHLWRDITLHAAILWTDIRIHDDRADQIRPYYEMYFERSKFSPIDVGYYSYNSTPTMPSNVISCVLQHIARVRRFIIIVEDGLMLSSIMTLFKDVAAPRL